MSIVSTSVHESFGLRHRAARVGPVSYFSSRFADGHGPAPARFIFAGRLSLARGPLDGLLEGVDEAARVRVLRHQHPSIVLAWNPPEPTDDWQDGDPNGGRS
jgi:hypothetical protein